MDFLSKSILFGRNAGQKSWMRISLTEEKVMICKRCGAVLSENARFCGRCGTKAEQETLKVERHCTFCGAKLTENQLICTSCGMRFREEQAKKAKSRKNKTGNFLDSYYFNYVCYTVKRTGLSGEIKDVTDIIIYEDRIDLLNGVSLIWEFVGHLLMLAAALFGMVISSMFTHCLWMMIFGTLYAVGLSSTIGTLTGIGTLIGMALGTLWGGFDGMRFIKFVRKILAKKYVKDSIFYSTVKNYKREKVKKKDFIIITLQDGAEYTLQNEGWIFELMDQYIKETGQNGCCI